MRKTTIAAVLSIGGITGAAQAAPLVSLRPAERPSFPPTSVVQAATSNDVSVFHSLRPEARSERTFPVSLSSSTDQDLAFAEWLKDFRHRAHAQGITSKTLGGAFNSVRYDPDVIRRDQNQAEFVKPIWDYLDSAVSDIRIANGQRALKTHHQAFEKIEMAYGVEKEIVAAVWGMESNYGTRRGDMNLIQSLATLAFDGRRSAFFEQQLIAALQILQAGDIIPERMTGSWAGAMGHTQFIPTSYLAYAVDFTGDGKRDIWSDDPSDALASTAAYLQRFGWVKGQPWGVEVRLPQGFDYTLAQRAVQKSPSDWTALGVQGVEGIQIPDQFGMASILLPAGEKGAAFMIFKNFSVIERYNAADAYVIGVGHLGDRLAGKPAIQATWPRDDRGLTTAERKEVQRQLTKAGFNTHGVDGRIGPNTISAVRAFQIAHGLIPDGHASFSLLKRLR